uniref:Uncharacterized protein n=1 Tax=Glossina pallidipes TaxID=7398 RepID=A0A1B0ACT5_GLOPL
MRTARQFPLNCALTLPLAPIVSRLPLLRERISFENLVTMRTKAFMGLGGHTRNNSPCGIHTLATESRDDQEQMEIDLVTDYLKCSRELGNWNNFIVILLCGNLNQSIVRFNLQSYELYALKQSDKERRERRKVALHRRSGCRGDQSFTKDYTSTSRSRPLT